MIELTAARLMAVMPRCPAARAQEFLGPLHNTLRGFDIGANRQRAAAFLAQIAHESGELRWTREIWGPTPAQLRYEGREGLGNTEPGDGKRYMGRGLIQVTGRANYAEVSKFFNVDFIGNPELLEQPEWATQSAGWFWHTRALNALADAGDFEKITRRINGGLNGLEDRQRFYAEALAVLGNEASA